MGFNKISKSFGVSVYLVLFIAAIPAAIFSPPLYQEAFIGMLTWEIGKFSFTRNRNKRFDVLWYCDDQFDDFMFTWIWLFVLVPKTPEIAGFFNHLINKVFDLGQDPSYELYYYLPGPTGWGVYRIAAFFGRWKKRNETV